MDRKKQILHSVLIAVGLVVVLALLIGSRFGAGKIEALYNRTVGVEVSSSQTDKFYATKAFTEGMAQDLSRYKLELAQTQDPVARGAIIAHINEQFANVDVNSIKNGDLQVFLISVRNGTIK